MTTSNTRIVLLLFGIFVTASSCRKFVELDGSEHFLESAKVFESDAAAASAATGVYVQMRINKLYFFDGAVSLYPSLSADDLFNTTANAKDDAFQTNALDAQHSSISAMWSQAYTTIYHINSVLTGLDRSTKISQAVREQLKGEMLFARSLYYFYLVNLFGDVPLVLETDYEKNGTMGRTPASQVYAQITGDLEEAEVLLTSVYASANRARPNKYAASALLARVFLYQMEWKKAEEKASEVISAGLYKLVPPEKTFLIASDETIFQIASDKGNTGEGGIFVPLSLLVKPGYALSPEFVKKFEAGDQRFTHWVGTNIINGQTYHYPYKYKLRVLTPVSEWQVVLRVAEQYLIRAEARLAQSDIIGARADINEIRKKAGLFPASNTDSQSLGLLLEKERGCEFFAEWGHRWLDLKRWTKATEVLKPLKGSDWQETDVLYPIPQSQIELNPRLVQNPGYF